MALGTMIKAGGGIAAMAAALAMLATPASAQDRGQGRGGRDGGGALAQGNGGGWRGNDGGNRGGDRGDNRGDAGGGGGRNFRGEAQSAPQTPTAPQAQVQAQAPRNWNRDSGDTGNRAVAQRQREGAQARSAPIPQVPSQQAQAERRGWSGNGQQSQRQQWQGQPGQGQPGQGRDNGVRDGRQRDSGQRDTAIRGNAGRDRSDGRWQGNAWRSDDARRRNDSPAWRGDRGNYASSWNREWRRDNRYDWRGYRSSNRNTYRLGAYYAPYRNYSYRRLNSGFRLDTLFFGSRYWINDPWQYRLPPADGPYRWVRYYDDAMLVDTYSGEVIDVIYDFFW
jgi:hypothetical protein